MKIKRTAPFILITAAILIWSHAAHAADDCATQQTQVDLNACAAMEFQRVDTELNKVYGEYRSRLNEQQKQQLRDVQLAWVKFRDLACKFESSGIEGGSAYPLILNQCLSNKTTSRLTELKSLADCEEGNLSCPVWK